MTPGSKNPKQDLRFGRSKHLQGREMAFPILARMCVEAMLLESVEVHANNVAVSGARRKKRRFYLDQGGNYGSKFQARRVPRLSTQMRDRNPLLSKPGVLIVRRLIVAFVGLTDQG